MSGYKSNCYIFEKDIVIIISEFKYPCDAAEEHADRITPDITKVEMCFPLEFFLRLISLVKFKSRPIHVYHECTLSAAVNIMDPIVGFEIDYTQLPPRC